jgi:hypothetical protein
MDDRANFKRTIAARLVAPSALAVLVAAGLCMSASANHLPSLTERASAGQINGNGALDAGLVGSSSDETHVFFATEEQLVSGDTDSVRDIYERTAGVTTRISAGQVNGNGPNEPNVSRISTDGTRVLFTTNEQLVSADTDSSTDLYERSSGTTMLVSAGQINGNGAASVFFAGASADCTRVFFLTPEQLVSADTDANLDVYQRSGGSTTLVSTGSSGNGPGAVSFSGASADGTHVFFRSTDQLASGDTDSSNDIYDRSGGATTRVSVGLINGNGAFDASFAGTSADGSRVFFTTAEQLVIPDPDSSTDIYERSGGTTTQVSVGAQITGTQPMSFAGSSNDGTHVFFYSSEPLASTDTDSSQDVYDRFNNGTTLVSTGPTDGNGANAATFDAVSANGSRAVFSTSEPLVSGDTDASRDVYEHSGDEVRQVSTGQINGNLGANAIFKDMSTGGERIFFSTDEKLVPSDTDSFTDLYERARGVTTLVSAGPTGGNGAFHVTYPTGPSIASDDGFRIAFQTGEQLASGDTDSSVDVYVARAPTGYARPSGATPYLLPLVPAYRECTNGGNIAHGPPFDGSACDPPIQASEFLTIGTPDANGQSAKASGSVRFDVIVGNPGTPADEADTSITLKMTDVRKLSDLSDYTGELLASVKLRMTDKLGGPSETTPVTAVDFPLVFDVPCAATADTTVGSTCSVAATVDGLIPNAVREGKRAISGFVDLELFDGGPDGNGATTPNTLFAKAGLFNP